MAGVQTDWPSPPCDTASANSSSEQTLLHTYTARWHVKWYWCNPKRTSSLHALIPPRCTKCCWSCGLVWSMEVHSSGGCGLYIILTSWFNVNGLKSGTVCMSSVWVSIFHHNFWCEKNVSKALEYHLPVISEQGSCFFLCTLGRKVVNSMWLFDGR